MSGSWAMTFQGGLGQGEVLLFGVQPSPELLCICISEHTPQTVLARLACPSKFSRD